MQLSADSYFMVILSIGFLSFIVACLLFFVHQPASLAARLLAGFLLTFSVGSICHALNFTTVVHHFPHLHHSLNWVFLCIGPLGYLYVRTALQRGVRLRYNELLLLFPAVMYTLISLPVYLAPAFREQSGSSRLLHYVLLMPSVMEKLLPQVWLTAASISFSILLLITQFILLARWKTQAFTNGNTEKEPGERFNWLLLFSITMLLLYVVVCALLAFDVPGIVNPDGLVSGTFACAMLFICLGLLVRPAILYGIGHSPMQAKEPVAINRSVLIIQDALPQPQKQPLSSSEVSILKAMLEEYFQLHQPFIKNGYTLKELAKQLNISSHQLSAMINQGYGKNFNELVNEHRVQYLRKLLDHSPEYFQFTLEALGREAGFNSRNAFIAAVKKSTGMKPSEFFGRKTAAGVAG